MLLALGPVCSSDPTPLRWPVGFVPRITDCGVREQEPSPAAHREAGSGSRVHFRASAERRETEAISCLLGGFAIVADDETLHRQQVMMRWLVLSQMRIRGLGRCERHFEIRDCSSPRFPFLIFESDFQIGLARRAIHELI